jgi:large repetitive protein
MKRTITCVSMLNALVTFMIDCQLVSAQTVVIPHTDRGWYRSSGTHLTFNLNYFAGDDRGPGCNAPCLNDYRNFFVFDLSSVVTPIASAKLAVYLPNSPAQLGPGYISGDPSENYELHDVVTSIATLLDGTGGVAAHADLGNGVVYGSRSMTEADIGNMVEITLNSAAIAALDAATGLIGIGGSLTTLDAVANSELVFTWSNTGNTATPNTELRLTLVPEPSSLFLYLAGIFATQLRRKCTRSPKS